MRKSAGVIAVIAALALVASAAWGAVRHYQAKASEFDPAKTRLVQGAWIAGIGCPTNAKTSFGTYTDPACTTGARDNHVRGLLLAKTGPLQNAASALARISGVKGLTLTELGYDIRKPGTAADDRGSHCGAGAPRFNVRTADGSLYFIGCNSPPGDPTPGDGWLRLRWGGSAPLMAYGPGGLEDIAGKTVKSITIVFDEGQDTGPDNFGMAVLDNIDINGTLIGHSGVASG
ncbi:MAG TPA: hypothetical protein VFW80_10880 [Gaiellaceae bacterium]|nr:hypothetical protein [Gaiellaceae bacterium]